MQWAAALALAVAVRAQTSGCGSNAWSAGATTTVDFAFDGTTYEHTVRTPAGYDPAVPAPLLLYFHGWGGSGSDCSDYCEAAAEDHGFITAGLTGIGRSGWSSWNGAGTANSPGADGATCHSDTSPDYCNRYSSCGGACADHCWWTTCKDSVGQALAFLDHLESELCVNLTMVWASGCSNGGIFNFELARDARSAPRLAGIAPQVGLPHNGFNFGPASPMHLFGMWGLSDTTMPPLSNTEDPTKSFDTEYSGWFFSTARNTTDRWADELGCALPRVDATGRWEIGGFAQLAPSATGAGCTARLGGVGGTAVVECVFDDGHVCDRRFMRTPLLAFMSTHAQVAPERVAPIPAPTRRPTVAPSPARCAALPSSPWSDRKCVNKCEDEGQCSSKCANMCTDACACNALSSDSCAALPSLPWSDRKCVNKCDDEVQCSGKCSNKCTGACACNTSP